METKVRSTASKTPPIPPFQCRGTHNHPVKPKPRWSKDGRAIRSNPSPALGPWSKGMARSVDRVGNALVVSQEFQSQIHIFACSSSVIKAGCPMNVNLGLMDNSAKFKSVQKSQKTLSKVKIFLGYQNCVGLGVYVADMSDFLARFKLLRLKKWRSLPK